MKIKLKKEDSNNNKDSYIESKYKNYEFEAETIFPIHIGSGEEWDALQYVIIDNYLYKFDLHNIMSKLSNSQQMRFMNIIENANRDSMITLRKEIESLFNAQNKLLEYCNFRCRVTDDIKKDYQDKINKPENQLLIKPFMRNANRLCIPGSSIKGAIRTALFQSWIDEKVKPKERIDSYDFLDERYRDIANDIDETNVNSSYKMNNLNQILHKTSGEYHDAKRDPLRCLKISDINLQEKTESLIVKVENIKKGREPDHQQMIECIPTGIKMKGEITIDSKLMDKEIFISENHKKNFKMKSFNLKDLCNACFDFYFDQIAEEDDRHKLIKQHLINKIQDLDNEFDEDNPKFTIIRLGRFSHVESVTFKPPFRKPRTNKGFGKARNMASIDNQAMPLGLLKLNFKE